MIEPKTMETYPIIVFGTGRSGTTIFNRMLSEHTSLWWLSDMCNKCPNRPELNRALMRLLTIPVLGSILRKKFRPYECYEFWNYYYKGFCSPFRDLVSSDVTKKNKHKIQSVISRMAGESNKHLLLKITGWPRLGFFSEIFNDAKFIHVIRDGRAVANSLINVEFWKGWQGPNNWRWGLLSLINNEEWEKYNQSFIVLAAIQWKILMDAFEEAKKNVRKSNLLEIRYEELCYDPVAVFKEVAAFCLIEWTSYFENRLRKYEVKDMNYKWERELNINQKRELNEVLSEYLVKYGYLS